jgi:hypothetical protein
MMLVNSVFLVYRCKSNSSYASKQCIPDAPIRQNLVPNTLTQMHMVGEQAHCTSVPLFGFRFWPSSHFCEKVWDMLSDRNLWFGGQLCSRQNLGSGNGFEKIQKGGEGVLEVGGSEKQQRKKLISYWTRDEFWHLHWIWSTKSIWIIFHHHHHHHHHELWSVRRSVCSLSLKVKLVLPSFPLASYASLTLWPIWITFKESISTAQ